MNRRHLTRRAPMKPMRESTWARIPMGDTGVLVYRIFMRDHRGAQQIGWVNVGPGIPRHEIAKRLRKERARLRDAVYELAGA